MKEKIEKILQQEVPKFFTQVTVYSMLGGKHIHVRIAASDHNINQVQGQHPQLVVIAISTWPNQEIEASGSRTSIMIKPTDRTYAMKGVKIPFRRTKGEDAILRAIRRFAVRYQYALEQNRENLMYQDIVDYDALLS